MTSGLSDIAAPHPVLAALEELEAALDQAQGTHAWTMTGSELGEALPRLTRAKARLAELELRVLVEADRASVGDEAGFTNTPLWWAHATRQTRPASVGALALARTLDDGHETTRSAMAAGAVLPEQAKVIVEAVEALPADLVDAAIRAEAESHLVALAGEHDARELRILGRRVLEVLVPEIAEEHERRLLEAEEQHAAASASFTMRPDGHGSMLGRFKIPVLAGEILAKHLNAIASPRHQAAASTTRNTDPTGSPTDPDAPAPRVARPLRLGSAFVEYLETRAASGMPRAGGLAATVVVTMSLESLLGADRAASLDTGEPISASEARRLACEAGIIPAVLGTRSQPLDLGRKSRFHTEAQRVAMVLRDGGCVVEHCDWPPGMCHGHHTIPWSHGGNTDLEDAVLLCPRHHTLAHDARYQLKSAKNGKVVFARRT